KLLLSFQKALQTELESIQPCSKRKRSTRKSANRTVEKCSAMSFLVLIPTSPLPSALIALAYPLSDPSTMVKKGLCAAWACRLALTRMASMDNCFFIYFLSPDVSTLPTPPNGRRLVPMQPLLHSGHPV